MKHKTYTLSLNVKDDSIGYAVMDENYHIIKHGHNNIRTMGVNKFKPGESAEDTRNSRVARRLTKRTVWRINLLNKLFKPEIDKIDPSFFKRLKHSYGSQKDPKYKGHYLGLFPTQSATQDYYEKYPTIYHLRNALMHEQHKFDVREIYLAVHHIVKHRGNFLNDMPMSSFTNREQQFDFQAMLDTLNSLYAADDNTTLISFQSSKQIGDAIEIMLMDPSLNVRALKKQLQDLLIPNTGNKTVVRLNKTIINEICNALIGNKFDVDKLFQLTEKTEVKLDFTAEDYEAQLSELDSTLTTDQQAILELLQNGYSYLALEKLIPDGQTVSAVKVKSYELFQKQLHCLKEFWKATPNFADYKKLHHLYELYAGFRDTDNPVDQAHLSNKKLDRATFQNRVKTILKPYAETKSQDAKLVQLQDAAKQIIAWIDQDQFLVKQRSSENMLIPHQLHQYELDQIINNQKAYYTFLGELNPNVSRRPYAKYMLDELVAFRIPYYVGPMVDNQITGNTSRFAWMKRKEGGDITPWNFSQKVDLEETANRFIRSLTAKDSYLYQEDVLPASSLLYQKFMVLNELNRIKIDGTKHLTVTQKQRVYNQLFKHHKTVTTKRLVKFMVDELGFKSTDADGNPALPTITGLSNPKQFTNSLSTYIDFANIIGTKADNPKYRNDMERIVEWSTVFPEGPLYRQKLSQLKWLTKVQQNQLANIHYHGWGNLSKYLLTKVLNDKGESVIGQMWSTNQNFMQVISKEAVQAQIAELNESYLAHRNLDEVLKHAYLAPANRKTIRQAIYLVNDIQEELGHAPAKIIVTFNRKRDEASQSIKRKTQMQRLYEALPTAFVKHHKKRYHELKNLLNSTKNLTDKEYLYFQQFGLDLFTGQPINYDQIKQAYMVHILQPSFVHDESMNNKALVLPSSHQLTAEQVRTKQRPLWDQLARFFLLTAAKMNNLLTDQNIKHLSHKAQEGYINRQLVAKGSVVKLLASILDERFANQGTKVIAVREEMQNQLRSAWNMPREYRLNDYWIAMDAYLAGIAGQYIYDCYPKLRPFIVYGTYQRNVDSRDLHTFNFLYKLLRSNEKNRADSHISAEELAYLENIKVSARNAYNFKKLQVNYAPYEATNQLYGETRFNHLKVKPKYIRLKKDRPVEIYGGYSQNTTAYMTIIKFTPRKSSQKPYLRVMQIRRLDSKNINRLLKQGQREQADKAILRSINVSLTSSEKKMKAEVAVPKVLINQIVDTGTAKFRLSSFKYKRSVDELVLSSQSRQTLYELNNRPIGDEQRANELIMDVYDDMLETVGKHFSLFNTTTSRKGAKSLTMRLQEYRNTFSQLPLRTLVEKNGNGKIVKNVPGKIATFNTILAGLYPDNRSADLDLCDANGDKVIKNFGVFSENGIKLPLGTKLFDVSPSGLHSRYFVIK